MEFEYSDFQVTVRSAEHDTSAQSSAPEAPSGVSHPPLACGMSHSSAGVVFHYACAQATTEGRSCLSQRLGVLTTLEVGVALQSSGQVGLLNIGWLAPEMRPRGVETPRGTLTFHSTVPGVSSAPLLSLASC